MTEIKCYCGHTDYCDCGPLPNLTAVQWLFEKLWDTPKDKFTWYALLKEAEEKYDNEIVGGILLGSNLLDIVEKDKIGKIHADKRNLSD